MKQITRYQPASADLIDPLTHTLTDREQATFVLGCVAHCLTSGNHTGMNEEIAERAAKAVLGGEASDKQLHQVRAYFTYRWGRLVEQVQSDRTINARLKEMGPVNVYQSPSE